MKLVQGDIGIVSEVDEAKMLVKIKWPMSGVVSPWLMIISPLVYYIPMINEQVACFYDEYRRQGVCFPRARAEGEVEYSDSDIIGLKLDTVEIFISRSTGKVTVITDDEVSVKATKVTLDADEVVVTKKLSVKGDSEFTGKVEGKSTIAATGNITSQADVKAGIIGLLTHKHATAATGPPSIPIP